MNRKIFKKAVLFLLAGLVIPSFLTSCLDVGDDDDTPDFGVYSTMPEEGATDVTLDSAVVITFETDVDPDTVTTSTFIVRDETGTAVSGDVYAEGVVADFRVDGYLEAETTYTVTLDESIADIYGRTLGDFLGSDYTFSFTTGVQTPE